MPAVAFCGWVGLPCTGLGILLFEDALTAWSFACRAIAASLENKIYKNKIRNKHNLYMLKKKYRNTWNMAFEVFIVVLVTFQVF